MRSYSASPQPPRLDLQPPTPVVGEEAHFGGHPAGHPPQPSSTPTPIDIPSGRVTRSHTPSSSVSSSYRAHPYSVSPHSRSRPPSAASWNERVGSETELEELDLDSENHSERMHVEQDPDNKDGLLGFTFSDPIAPPDSSLVATHTASQLAESSGSIKAKTSHARKAPPGHIKRPPNAFILFRSHCCAPNATPETVNAPGTPSAQQLADLGITDHRHISRIASHLWKALADEERAYWEDRAKQAKQEHMRLHPEYRYKPVYRKKDEVRRRKKGFEAESQAEIEACEHVATSLLNEERESKALQREGSADSDSRGKWAMHTLAAVKVVSGTSTGQRRPRPSRAKRSKTSNTSSSSSALSSSYQDSYADEPHSYGESSHFLEEPFDFDDRPHSAPSGEFTLAESGRRISHGRTVSYGQPTQDAQFSYMEVLNQSHAHPPPHRGEPLPYDLRRRRSNTFSYYPQHGAATYAPTAPEQHPSHVASGLPYNPTFSYYPAPSEQQQQQQHLHPSHLPTQDQAGRPITPRSSAMHQLHSYNFQDATAEAYRTSQGYHQPEAIISPTGTTFEHHGAPEQVHSTSLPDNLHLHHPMEQRRISESMDLALRGMKRRGTLTRATEGGDLMLISPTSDTFGSRKFSLGRWERRMPSGVEEGQEALKSPESFPAFDFDKNFFSFLPQPAPDSEHVEEGGSQSGYSSSSEYSGLAAFHEHERPTSSSSDFSADGSVNNERQAGFGMVDPKQVPEAFHVGQADFFVPPAPAHPFVFGTSPPTSEAPPVFNQDIFQTGATYTKSHRPSIDALLANSTHNYQKYPRGSDATIRMRDVRSKAELEVPSKPASKQDTALSIINQQLQGRAAAEFETQYVYLSPEQAADASLIELILSHGVGVSYDADLSHDAGQHPSSDLPPHNPNVTPTMSNAF